MKLKTISFKASKRFTAELRAHVIKHTNYQSTSEYIRFSVASSINRDLCSKEKQQLIPDPDHYTIVPIIRPMLPNETIPHSIKQQPITLTTGEQLTAFAKAIRPPIWLPLKAYHALNNRPDNKTKFDPRNDLYRYKDQRTNS